MKNDKEFKQNRALWPFMRRMLRYAFRYPRWMLSFLFWICVVSVIDAVYPLILIQMIDGYIAPALQALREQGTPFDYSGLYYYGGIFFVVSAIQIIGIYIFIQHTGRVREYVMTDLREAMFRRLQRLSFSFYDKNATGWLLSRLVSDTDRVAELISWGLIEVLWGLSMILFCILVLMGYHWQLGLMVAASIPVMLIASVRIRKRVLDYSRQSRKINSELTATYNEHINGIAINKSTAQEARVSSEFEQVSERMRRVSYRAAFHTALYIPLVIVIGSLAAAAVIYWGGQITLAGGITVGVLIAAFDYATKIFLPISDISMFYATAQSSLSAGERIFSLIEEPIEIADKPDATDFGRIRGEIRFENVDFQYVEGHPVLQQFNLHIPAGQTLALVGATGEGKTTIANLVARFYEPTGGVLRIDGEDYQQKTLRSLRAQLGIVLQTPHLFAGSIRDNIRYGKPEANDAEIRQALDLVGAPEFGERLDEEVGEEGGRLSVGEKQLLSFARALLIRPAILIMDEATSSIDTITEARIQAGIRRILEGRTAIVIAHRLSTIKNADRILVIQGGKIAEAGSHGELMAQKGKYYELYTRQLRAEVLQ